MSLQAAREQFLLSLQNLLLKRMEEHGGALMFIDILLFPYFGHIPSESEVEEMLDDCDSKATKLDPGFARRHPRMTLLTEAESNRRLEEIRNTRL